MIVVADASVLVGELLRRRGRELLGRPDLRVLVAEEQWDEAQHELSRRLDVLESRRGLTAEQRLSLEKAVSDLIETRAIEVVPREAYGALEQAAVARVPRDRRDWPTVAAAMALRTGILTGDNDFLGLRMPHLDRRDAATRARAPTVDRLVLIRRAAAIRVPRIYANPGVKHVARQRRPSPGSMLSTAAVWRSCSISG